MRRRLLNLLTALSLLLCVAAALMWARSYRVGENWRWDNNARGLERSLYSVRGQLSFYDAWWDPAATDAASGQPAPPPNKPTRFTYHRWANPTAANLGRVQVLLADKSGRAYGPRFGLALFLFWPGSHGIYHVEVMIPYWLVTLLPVAPPALWLLLWRRRRRTRGRICLRCGYDLRATPGRCPECGTVAANPATAGAGG